MSELCSVPRVLERFAQSNALDEDIARLKYVSGKREEALRRLGIRTVGDLLLHIPHRYLDFTRSWSIEMAPIGTVCTIIATVDRIVQKQPRPRMQVTEVSLVDETGVLQVAFFRQPWIAQQLKQGDRLAVMGKVEFAYGFKQMASPHFEKLEEGRAAGTILPVHYVSDGVSQAWMRRIVSGALEVVGNPFDPIPARLRVKRRLMSNARALRSIHFPSSMAERDIARRRLAYEECLYLQLALRLRNDGGLVDVVPYAHTAGEHLAALKQALPFSLSDEQEVAFQDILRDMCDGGRVMNRLLLGDVGTGKTAVAACAQAVCISLGQPISSSAIPAKADDKDTLIFPADLTGSMETALGSQKLRLETGLTNTDLFKEIYKSLKKKKPVIALMLVADAESAKLQYGVVTGLDVSNNRVTVALSEGVDTYTLAEFVAATRFENTKNIPLRLRFSLLFGTLSRNTAIFLK